jgi:hypothetical protein
MPRLHAHEQRPALGIGAPAGQQIVGERVAAVDQQRQPLDAIAFAAHQ